MNPDLTLAEHRRAFQTDNHFDGPPRLIEWVRLGPLPIPIPNPPARRRALRLHDLHHLITGYGTDWQGEWQISAWEVGGGLHRNPVAWMFCLMGMTAGLVAAPRLTLRAYARGRRGRTLLGQDPDAVDRLTLAEGRAFCGVDQPPPPVTAADVPRAIGWGLLGVVVAVLPPLAWALSRLDRAPAVRVPAPADGDPPAIERTATPA
ncbi:MAG: hypothetical protein R3F65_05285 [bacterium]|nr:hypothetical protein [Myxococcales bacterium]